MKKNKIILLLVLLLCCCLIVVSCSNKNNANPSETPAEDSSGSNPGGGDGGDGGDGDEPLEEIIVYTLVKGTYAVTSYNSPPTAIVIPAKYNDVPVTRIYDSAFEDCDTLTSVTFEEGSQLESIGEGAFFGCDALETMEIPNTVKSIGDYAFTGCSSLKNLTIPNDLEVVGFGAFSECVSLRSISIPANIETIKPYAYYDCGVSEIVIPEGVKTIGENAFDNCQDLVRVTLPSTLETIGEDAFLHCEELVEVCNKSSLVLEKGSSSNGYVAKYAKQIYSQLESTKITWDDNDYIIYTDGVDRILLGYDGPSRDLVIPDGITEIYRYAFRENMSIYSVQIPNTVTKIGEDAFDCCRNILSITIPESVTVIENYAFGNDFRLVEVYNKSALSITMGSEENGMVGKYAKNIYTEANGSKLSIEDDEFVIYTGEGNERILAGYIGNKTSVTIPSDVTSIRAAFYGYEKMTSVTIPRTLTKIDDMAFEDCTGLTSVTIPNTITYIGKGAFCGCYFLKEVIFEENSTLTTIDNDAFNTCMSLTTVTIPSSVTTIGADAFGNCLCLAEVYNLSSVLIEVGSDENGGAGAFAKDVYTDPNAPSKLSIINNDYVVYTDGDEKILVRYIGTGSTAAIPSEVTKIGWASFYMNYNIINVGIPSNVKEIESFAFVFCRALRRLVFDADSSLTKIGEDILMENPSFGRIFYSGTKSEWDAINKEVSYFTYDEEYMYYYSETEPTTPGNYWHIVNDALIIWEE